MIFLASIFLWRIWDEVEGIRLANFCCVESKDWVANVIKFVAELPQTANKLFPNVLAIKGKTERVSKAGKITTNFVAQRRNMLWSVDNSLKFKLTLGLVLVSKYSAAVIPKMMYNEHVVIKQKANVICV